jgi:cytidine deaminase
VPGGERLVADAGRARDKAIAPYSMFKVGAALLAKDGTIVTGCNIENASYGLTMCAERVALFKALSDGHRDFTAVAVVTGADDLTPPCGACRQLLWEYCGDILVVLANTNGQTATHRLGELLPHPFGLLTGDDR